MFPSRHTLLTGILSSLLGGIVAIGVSDRFRPAVGAVGEAPPPFDQRYVALGQAYLPQLGEAYASAWDEGAKALDAGKTIPSAVDTVGQAWTANRTALYDKVLTPELAKIVPEDLKDSAVTPAQRAAMAAGWRGFAIGLRK